MRFNIESLEFEIQNVFTAKGFTLFLFHKEERIGHLSVIDHGLKIVAFDSFIKTSFRRKGLASRLYQEAEKISQKAIIPYEHFNSEAPSSEDIVEFWRSRGVICSNGPRLDD